MVLTGSSAALNTVPHIYINIAWKFGGLVVYPSICHILVYNICMVIPYWTAIFKSTMAISGPTAKSASSKSRHNEVLFQGQAPFDVAIIWGWCLRRSTHVYVCTRSCLPFAMWQAFDLRIVCKFSPSKLQKLLDFPPLYYRIFPLLSACTYISTGRKSSEVHPSARCA